MWIILRKLNIFAKTLKFAHFYYYFAPLLCHAIQILLPCFWWAVARAERFIELGQTRILQTFVTSNVHWIFLVFKHFGFSISRCGSGENPRRFFPLNFLHIYSSKKEKLIFSHCLLIVFLLLRFEFSYENSPTDFFPQSHFKFARFEFALPRSIKSKRKIDWKEFPVIRRVEELFLELQVWIHRPCCPSQYHFFVVIFCCWGQFYYEIYVAL